MSQNIIDHQSTKIVATVGPACSDYDNLKALARAGVDVFRLNFSHGTHEDHKVVIDRIHKLNKELNIHLGILCDLQGPKLRIGKMEENVVLQKGDEITFTAEECLGNKQRAYMSYKLFAQDVNEGDIVKVDDGKLVFKVKSTDKKSEVVLETLFGGPLKSNKGVNLPDTAISLPCLTEKDLRDLEFILKQDIHWIALSFVREAKDVHELREHIDRVQHRAKIISKIEKPEAVKNIKKIIKASNAIMVARGDLGVEVPMEQLPGIQKSIIKKCIQRARPVIVATQMMESMITNPSPTRAEITDVANAVIDGTDAVMLSGETSVGKHPVKVVEAMNKIIAEAEKSIRIRKRPVANENSSTFLSDVVCFNAAKTADEIYAKAIVGMTTSGYTAFKLSSYRPKAKIYIFSDYNHILCTLNLVWGVRTYYYDKFTSTDETVKDVVKILKENNRVKIGDVMVNTGSMPLEKRYRTNMLKVTLVD